MALYFYSLGVYENGRERRNMSGSVSFENEIATPEEFGEAMRLISESLGLNQDDVVMRAFNQL